MCSRWMRIFNFLECFANYFVSILTSFIVILLVFHCTISPVYNKVVELIRVNGVVGAKKGM